MKFFKLCSAMTAIVFFGAAVGMFALSFVDLQTVVLGKGSVTHLATGFEIAFGQTKLEAGNILGTLFAFIFIALGLCAALCLAVLALKGGKSKKAINLKLLGGCCAFAVCGILPAVLLFLTLQTTASTAGGVLGGGLLGAEYKLGVGAILSAIFSLVGGTALGAAVIK